MGTSMGDLEITKKVKIIEQLKSQLLTDVASLYGNMASDEINSEDNLNLLADIVILTYFLTEKLGTSYDGLDIRIKNKLKLALINEKEHSQWRTQLSQLARYFDSH